jgi:plastin-1
MMVTHVSFVQDGEAYAAYLLKALAPGHSPEVTLVTKDPSERAKLILEQAEKLDEPSEVSALSW